LKKQWTQDIWLVIFLLALTTIFLFVSFFRFMDLNFFIGPFRFTHWLSLAASLFIAIFTPIYYVLKRKRPKYLKWMLRTHIFGNLSSFMLISIHFAQQISRPAAFYPDLGTGVILFVIMLIMLPTGILQRFQFTTKFGRHPRIFHTYLPFFFYTVILIHMLHGFGILG
jgi:hypothetical protein